eukprot:1136806-Pelagomonas_calceolata.AAC.3
MMHELVQYALAVAAKGPLTREALVEYVSARCNYITSCVMFGCVAGLPGKVQVIVRTSLLDLVEVGLDEATASDALLGRVDAVLAWVARYMGPDVLAGQAPRDMQGNKPGACETLLERTVTTLAWVAWYMGPDALAGQDAGGMNSSMSAGRMWSMHVVVDVCVGGWLSAWVQICWLARPLATS